MKAWLKGSLIGLAIFLVGLISLFLDQVFFGGATSIFDFIYKAIFFISFILRSLVPDIITADYLGLIVSPIFYFIIGGIIGAIIGKRKND